MRMDAEGWNSRYASTELVWSAAPNVFVEEELSYLPPGRALDLACGEGRNALWLAQRGWDVTAVDFSKVAIKKGRNIERMRRTSGRPGVASSFGYIHWKVADATTFTSERDFDVVVMAYVQLPAEPRRAADPRRVRDAAAGRDLPAGRPRLAATSPRAPADRRTRRSSTRPRTCCRTCRARASRSPGQARVASDPRRHHAGEPDTAGVGCLGPTHPRVTRPRDGAGSAQRHSQRWSSGTCVMTWATWLPQPDQVVLLHWKQCAGDAHGVASPSVAGLRGLRA